MRAPPPVEYRSALDHAWRGLWAACVACAVAVPLAGGLPYVAALSCSVQPAGLLAFLLALPASPVVQAAAAATTGAVVFAAFWRSRSSVLASERILRWDGQEWLLPGGEHGPDQRGTVALMLDLGPWMLVRFLPHGGRRGSASWLPFTLGGDVVRWAALRGALWTWRGNAPGRP